MRCPTDAITRFALDACNDRAEERSVTDHLLECPGCRRQVEQERDLTQRVWNVQRVAVPPGFASMVIRRICASAEATFSSRWQWQVACSVTLVLAALGGFCVLLDQGLKRGGTEVLDAYILQAFALGTDVLLFALKSAVSTGQLAIHLAQMFSGMLLTLAGWLMTVSPVLLWVAVSLFMVSHGTLYLMLRQDPRTKEPGR